VSCALPSASVRQALMFKEDREANEANEKRKTAAWETWNAFSCAPSTLSYRPLLPTFGIAK
jgi:hypothetical protein